MINENKAIDFIDVALGEKPIEGSENRINMTKDNTMALPIKESTIQNVQFSENINMLGYEIGRSMVGYYNDNDAQKFIDNIKEGYYFQKKVKIIEEQESERIAKLFEENFSNKTLTKH